MRRLKQEIDVLEDSTSTEETAPVTKEESKKTTGTRPKHPAQSDSCPQPARTFRIQAYRQAHHLGLELFASSSDNIPLKNGTQGLSSNQTRTKSKTCICRITGQKGDAPSIDI